MATTFPFRVIRGSWGIAIDVTASLRQTDLAPLDAVEVVPDVYLVVASSLVLPDVDSEFVRAGLRRVSAQLKPTASGGAVCWTPRSLRTGATP
jgi:hypothetical protein